MLYLENKIKEVAAKSNIDGVMAMADCANLSYERTARVWRGDETAKIADVRQILNSVGYDLKIVKCSLIEPK